MAEPTEGGGIFGRAGIRWKGRARGVKWNGWILVCRGGSIAGVIWEVGGGGVEREGGAGRVGTIVN